MMKLYSCARLDPFSVASRVPVRFLCGLTDRLFTYRFYSVISHNNTVPRTNSYSGPGRCISSTYSSVPSSGVNTLECDPSSESGRMLTVGRFVTVLPYSSISDESLAEYTWPEVLAVCEVAVVGVLQNISADGKCFNLAPGYVKAAADAKK